MPFEAVAETLLKGGVAPRHVRRYVRELDEHLDDLTAQQRQAGYEDQDAAIRARARLGEDGELAAAMLSQPGFRSWPARLPWLVFLLLPPVVTVVAALPVYALFFFLGDGAAKIAAVAPISESALVQFSQAMLMAINALAPASAAALFVLLAHRQRLAMAWPLLGILLLVLLFPHFGYRFGHRHDGQLQAAFTPLFVPGDWREVARYWQLVTAQWFLALLPALWLVRVRRKSA